MIYVISKATFGSYDVRDIQCNANWDCCPYSEYALIPESMVDEIIATQGYCDITLNDAGTEVLSYTARTIPTVQEECCGTNTVLSVNGVTANTAGALTLTPNDVGAAPAGYGYGGEPVTLSANKINDDAALNTALEAVYSGMNARETKLVRFYGFPSTNTTGVSDFVFFGFLFKSSDNYGSFMAHSSYKEGCMITKTKFNGAWKPLEWENPPLEVGEEYRTTERFYGEPVYAQMINFGSVSNSTKEVYVADYVGDVVRIDGYWYDKANKLVRAPFTSASFLTNAMISQVTENEKNTWKLIVATEAAGSNYYGLPVVYYTKRTL